MIMEFLGDPFHKICDICKEPVTFNEDRFKEHRKACIIENNVFEISGVLHRRCNYCYDYKSTLDRYNHYHYCC